jgi:hypothetical protein
MSEALSEELFEEAPEKLLPFRFELLARSLICHGGYTFADIVEKESNALFQLISNQKSLIDRADYPEEIFGSLLADDLKVWIKLAF